VDLLTTEITPDGAWTRVRVTGQLDIATAPMLDQRLVEVQVDAAQRILIDLDGVEFVDALGLGVLLAAYRRAQLTGGQVVVVCGTPRLRTVLDQAGLTRILTIVADRPAVAD
jgi:anti-sigma B factor antagonist